MIARIFSCFLLCLLSSLANAGAVTYIYTDPQGTSLAEADASGNITTTYDYRPYGSIALGTAREGPGYTGHVSDPDTALTYMQARYYDAAAARFLSVDPASLAPGKHFSFGRYTYANDNPYSFIDRDGRESVGEMIDAGAHGCNPVSCAGWAALSATWTVLGAEGVSQVADKGWSGTSGGSRASAGLEIASVLPPVRLARAAAPMLKGGAEAVRIGQAGERAVRAVVDIGPKVGITVNGVARIPDGLTLQAVNEVKNVAYLSYTSQLRDFAQFAKDTGRQFNLFVREDTKLSRPLENAAKTGEVRICTIEGGC